MNPERTEAAAPAAAPASRDGRIDVSTEDVVDVFRRLIGNPETYSRARMAARKELGAVDDARIAFDVGRYLMAEAAALVGGGLQSLRELGAASAAKDRAAKEAAAPTPETPMTPP